MGIKKGVIFLKKYDVITVLDVCVDLMVFGDTKFRYGQMEQLVDDYELEMGGSASIFACQCAKLGLKTAGVGVVGDDTFGSLFLEKLEKSGVDTTNLNISNSIKTGVGIALCKGDDRAVITYPGTIFAVTPEMILDTLPLARHLHIASYFLIQPLRNHWLKIVKKAKELSMTVSLDTNCDPYDKWEGIEELKDYIDIFMPNEDEAMIFGKENNLEDSIKKLAETFPLVIAKCGPKGAIGFDGQEILSVPSKKVVCADAVGAGDTFDAGFLYGWLNGKTIKRSMEIGCYCGAMNVTKNGGIEGQPWIGTLPEELKD